MSEVLPFPQSGLTFATILRERSHIHIVHHCNRTNPRREMDESGFVTPVEGESQMIEVVAPSNAKAIEFVQALLQHENSFYPPCNDYLSILSSFPLAEADPVSESWRRKLSEWCYEGKMQLGSADLKCEPGILTILSAFTTSCGSFQL